MNSTLLQESLKPLMARGAELADRFYEHLFGAYPELQRLFAGTDMDMQGQRLLQALALVAKGSKRPKALARALDPLARRHVFYGIEPEHYPLFCRALLEAMGRVGGSDWSEAAAGCWAEALEWISEQMIATYRQAASPGIRAS